MSGEQLVELATERLILREFRESDCPDVLAYQSDPLYLRYTEWTERTLESVRNFVRVFIDQQQEQPRTKYQLAIILKSTRQLIGNCGLRMESPDAREADIGCELSPKRWGQGYAAEAVRVIIAFGFTELHLHRIWARCIADNIGAVRVLQKVGMQQEGRLRDKEYFRRRWWDSLIFSILEDEWRAR